MVKALVGNGSVLSRKESIWWRDLIKSDISLHSTEFDCVGAVCSKVCNEKTHNFGK